jgi:hypothetical protein
MPGGADAVRGGVTPMSGDAMTRIEWRAGGFGLALSSSIAMWLGLAQPIGAYPITWLSGKLSRKM